jgi:hypothetical protein
MPKPKGDLESLIIPKGEPAPAPAASKAPPAEEARKALTVKLRMTDYLRLRRFALVALQTHQEIVEAAIDQWLRERGH